MLDSTFLYYIFFWQNWWWVHNCYDGSTDMEAFRSSQAKSLVMTEKNVIPPASKFDFVEKCYENNTHLCRDSSWFHSMTLLTIISFFHPNILTFCCNPIWWGCNTLWWACNSFLDLKTCCIVWALSQWGGSKNEWHHHIARMYSCRIAVVKYLWRHTSSEEYIYSSNCDFFHSEERPFFSVRWHCSQDIIIKVAMLFIKPKVCIQKINS